MAQQTSTPHFATQSRSVLSGSEKRGAEQAVGTRPAAPGEHVTVSVIVRRKNPLAAAHVAGKQRLTRSRFNAQHAADPAAVALVKRFAREFGLKVQAGTPAPGRRTIKLTGTGASMQRAFGVSLSYSTIDGVSYRVRDGSIHLPAELHGYVVAVLGLDNRPQAKPHFRVLGGVRVATAEAATAGGFARPHAAGSGSFTPVQIGRLYQFPQGITASGQTIGIIELGGGFRQADIAAYFKSLGQKPPAVIALPVGTGKNSPGGPNGADGEVMLDIEVAGAVATGARIVVYFAANTDQGFVDAIATAIHDVKNKPSVISISWGAAEINWTAQAMAALDAACQSAAALGITITAAAGDNGSSDGVTDGKNHVDVPDVAGDADPATGYVIRVDGKTMVIGGTSAVAPLWAGLIAVANQQNGKHAGFIQPAIYAAKNKAAFRDTSVGDNGSFKAGLGWDACTGLGSPIAPRVISAIKPGASASAFKIAASRKKAFVRKSK